MDNRIEKLNEELDILKGDASRLSVYIEDSIQAEDYEEAGSFGKMLNKTCKQIAELEAKIKSLKNIG